MNVQKTVFVIGLLLLVSQVSADVAPALEEEIDQSHEDDILEVLVATNDIELHEFNFSQSLDVEISRNYDSVNAALLELPASSIENISDRSFIERVGPNYQTEAMLSDSRHQIEAPEYPTYDYGGGNVSVAVLDSGVAEHRYLELENQVDFTGEGTGDLSGHGTHVAGIIGSQHSVHTGVAPETNIHDVKVLKQDGMGTASQLIRGLDYAVQNDIDVAVLSLGSSVERCNGFDVMSKAVDTAKNKGLVPVVAAGNYGLDDNTVTAPGCSRKALTVGSVDKQDNIATYSSRGPTSDQRVKPDVLAPGTSIVSTADTGEFKRLSGTSMAAPHVAGQAAILISEGEEHRNVKQNIMNSSEDLGHPENTQGMGRVNIEASIQNINGVEHDRKQGLWTRFKAWITTFTRF